MELEAQYLIYPGYLRKVKIPKKQTIIAHRILFVYRYASKGAPEMVFFYSSSRMRRTMVSPWFEEGTIKLNDAAPVEIVEGVTGSVVPEILAGPEVAPSGIGVVREAVLVGIRAVTVWETEFEAAIVFLLETPKPTILCKSLGLQGGLLSHYLVLSSSLSRWT